MCINPSYVWQTLGGEWSKTPVPCKLCWRCKRNRMRDYIGRALCEASVSQATCAITLTYAPRDDYADKILQPRHFQTFIKSLRNGGHKVRYLVAGEYGELKSRAHFHAVLFFSHLAPLQGRTITEPGKPPVQCIVPRYIKDYDNPQDQQYAPFCAECRSNKMLHIREWPHGHIQADWTADERAMRYVVKYILKDKEDGQSWFSLSKKPTLGAGFFAEKAEAMNAASVVPNGFGYMPPGASQPGYMTGATRRDYIRATVPQSALPIVNEWIAKTYEKHAKAARLKEAEQAPLQHQFEQWAANRADQQERETIARALADARYWEDLQNHLDTHGFVYLDEWR